jgi:hypothetical protein
MKDDISQLLEFLDRNGPEACGRGPAGLEAEQVTMIERFISGGSDQAEVHEVTEFLQMHPAWIRWVADRVKLARELDENAVDVASARGEMRA